MLIRLVEQDGDVVEVEVWSGDIHIVFVADVRLEGDTVVIAELHVEGPGPGTAGIAILRSTARLVMEHFDVRELRVEGARRTSGAGPGRIPGPFRLRR